MNKNNVYSRPDGSDINLIDLYKGKTCFLIGNGPSLSLSIENELLFDPRIFKYTMNNSIEPMRYNTNIWSCVDRPGKFNKQSFQNTNFLKLLPKHRIIKSDKNRKSKEDVTGYNDNGKTILTRNCPGVVSVDTFYVEKQKQRNFIEEYINSDKVTYGIMGGHKSVLLFTLKNVLLMGFSKVILIGVDLTMNMDNPYYNKSRTDYKIGHLKNHVNHNNRLYGFLIESLNGINRVLSNDKTKYNCEIYTSKRINGVTIPEIDINDVLREEISNLEK